jgi:hypothetical protein
MRILHALLLLPACTDLPDHDDPREVGPAEVPCTDLLINGSFDSGASAWTGDTSTITDDLNVPNMVPIVADSGRYFAWLGGVVSMKRTLSQPITIPDGVTMLRLDAKLCVASEMAGADGDTLKLGLDGTAARTLTNMDATDRSATVVIWKQLTVMIPTTGQHAMFQLISSNDASNNTNFFFDSLKLVPSTCM